MYNDSAGNMISMQTLDSQLKPNFESTYTYNKSNKLILSMTKNLNNQSEIQREYWYDKELRLSKIVESNLMNKKSSTTKYKYDEKGNQTSYLTTQRNGKLRESKTEYKYFDDYYEKIGFSAEGYQDAYFKLDYDENILTRIFYNSDGSIRNTSHYVLDQYGNWTQETFEADDFFALSVRTIEYYSEE